jgi:asparagine synthase (glutamine-hydrolysing)
MCGIAGIIGPNQADDERVVENMLSVIKHRGPDDTVVQRFEGACLGHVRLSIIDVGNGGKQPAQSKSGLSLVFNGMIYNYIELKKALTRHYNFLSRSDTEVLLAAFDIWGSDCLEKLNGMFAFCAFNQETKLASFVRDRFGQKPLFYAFAEGRLFFASEVKSLIAAGFEASSNQNAWANYLSKGNSDASRETFFENIFQLGAAEIMEFQYGLAPKISKYFQLRPSTLRRDMSDETVARKLYELLSDAVDIHMRSDVPVGISLSGGFDSSSLLALLDNLGHLSEPIKCLSVDFGANFSEKEWIERAAQHHNLKPQIYSYKPEECIEDFDKMLWHLEAPSGGIMNFALGKVMSGAKDNGVRVIHDGTGLDEAFAGYMNHHAAYIGQLGLSGDGGYEDALNEFALNWGYHISKASDICKRVALSENTAIDGTNSIRKELLNISEDHLLNDGEEKTPVFNIHENLVKYFVKDKIPRNMRMKDRLSMSYGIELRLPFLDHRLVEFALTLPASMYFLGGRSKAIVRSAMRGHMNESVRLAKKRSVQSPQGTWLGSEPMQSFVGDLIHSRSFIGRPLLKHERVKKAFNDYCTKGSENSFFIWQWLNYEMWHRIFID